MLTYIGGRLRRGEISPRTAYDLRWRLSLIETAHGQRPLQQLGPATIDRWLEATSDHRPNTRQSAWSATRCFLDWMVATGEIRRNPLDGRKAPKVPRCVPNTLDEDQVARLLAASPDTRTTAIIWLEVGGALRSVEVARLNVEHWSRGAELLVVNGKAGHQREVPVLPEMRRAMSDYLAEHPASGGPMFRSYKTGHRLTPRAVAQLIRELMWGTGIKVAAWDGRGGHSLRRTCASDVLESSGDPVATQDLLGHVSLATMDPYLRRANMDRMRSAMSGRSYRG